MKVKTCLKFLFVVGSLAALGSEFLFIANWSDLCARPFSFAMSQVCRVEPALTVERLPR